MFCWTMICFFMLPSSHFKTRAPFISGFGKRKFYEKKRSPFHEVDPAVLLVEDEEHIRSLMRKLLEDQNIPVIEATNGPEALHLFRQHRQRIRVLITDMMMPYMDGRELAQKIRLIEPEIKIIFMSGFPLNIFFKNEEIPAESRFLQKPFNAAALRDILIQVAKETDVAL